MCAKFCFTQEFPFQSGMYFLGSFNFHTLFIKILANLIEKLHVLCTNMGKRIKKTVQLLRSSTFPIIEKLKVKTCLLRHTGFSQIFLILKAIMYQYGLIQLVFFKKIPSFNVKMGLTDAPQLKPSRPVEAGVKWILANNS